MATGHPLTAAVIDLTAVAGLLFVADRVLDPLPFPAAIAAAAGLLALWFLRGARSGLVILALFGGALAGAAHHAYRHLVGASPMPAEGIPIHLLLDLMAGLFAALLAVSAALAIRGLRQARSSRRSP